MMRPPVSRVYTAQAGTPETELPKGDVTEGVVRVGDTVRRPHQPQSLTVAGYLDHLERAGFAGAPRFLGRDDQGRDVLTYLDGEVPGDPPEAWAAADAVLASVGELVRDLHEASRGYVPPPDAVWRRNLVKLDIQVVDPPVELVSHLDVTPQNVVFRDGRAVGLIDFDLTAPTTRLMDVYNTAMHWVPLRPEEDLPPAWRGIDQAGRLRLFVDAYGLSRADRLALPDLGIDRADVAWLRMRAAAEQLGGGWARMWDEGVGDAIRRRQSWMRDNRAHLLDVLD